MTKYEEKIEARIKEFDWEKELRSVAPDDEFLRQLCVDGVFRSFQAPLDSNCRRALKEYYYYDVTGVHKRTDLDTLPVLDMPCAEYENVPSESGVYFIGMIGTNPDGKSYHLVKIGKSDNLKVRIRQYATYNPMIYIGGYYLTKNSEAENNSHQYLRKKAYAMAMHANEWYYVDEQTYYELCDTFADEEMFAAIAEGRD